MAESLCLLLKTVYSQFIYQRLECLKMFDWKYYRQIEIVFQSLQLLVGIVGIVGNGLTFAVFSRKVFKAYSFSFYYKIMTLTNIAMLVHTLRHWTRVIFGVDLDTMCVWMCKLCNYQIFVAISTSLWLLSLISVDRLVIIAYHNRFNIFKNRLFQIVLVAFVFIYSLLIHINIPFYSTIIKVKPNANASTPHLMCVMPPKIFAEISRIYLLNTFAVNIVINNIVNVKLTRFITLTHKNSMVNSRHRHITIKHRRFAISLIGLNISSFLCNLPLAIIQLFCQYLDPMSNKFKILLTVAIKIAMIDNVAPFFINIFLNRLFFEEFLVMVGLKKNKDLTQSP